jgi:hypothetical protein
MAVSILLQRQIEQISTRAVVQKRAERLFSEDKGIIPQSPDIVAGKRYYTYPIVNMQGRAALIANSSFDVPGVDAFVEERTQKIELLYQPWSIPFPDEIEASAAGVNINGIQIELAAQSIYNAVDDLGYVGSPNIGLFGIANQPNALAYTLPADGTAASTRWINKTAEQILRDIQGMAYFSSKVTSHAYRTTHIMIPPSAFEPLTQKWLAQSGVAETPYVRYLINQGLTIDQGSKVIYVAPGLETAGTGGTPMAICFNPRPDYIEMMSTPTIQRPLFESVEGVRSALVKWTGAVLCRQPLSVVNIFGI